MATPLPVERASRSLSAADMAAMTRAALPSADPAERFLGAVLNLQPLDESYEILATRYEALVRAAEGGPLGEEAAQLQNTFAKGLYLALKCENRAVKTALLERKDCSLFLA